MLLSASTKCQWENNNLTNFHRVQFSDKNIVKNWPKMGCISKLYSSFKMSTTTWTSYNWWKKPYVNIEGGCKSLTVTHCDVFASQYIVSIRCIYSCEWGHTMCKDVLLVLLLCHQKPILCPHAWTALFLLPLKNESIGGQDQIWVKDAYMHRSYTASGCSDCSHPWKNWNSWA